METRVCLDCRTEKLLVENYYRGRRDGFQSRCKECDRKRSRRHQLDHPVRTKLAHIRCRARQKNVAFDLEERDIVIPKCCPILGIELQDGSGKGTKHAPGTISFDRVDPSGGYTKDNIQIISMKANTMKADATPEELLKFAEWIMKTYKPANDNEPIDNVT